MSPFLQALIKTINFYGRFTPTFTRVGFVARGLPFRPLRADLTEQNWLITGASGGLGRAAALAAAGKGARVFAVGRNTLALSQLVLDARALSGTILPVVCDLSSMAAIAAVTRQAVFKGVAFDVLINNVGILLRSYSRTPEGFETSYATNLLGHYMLTELLFAEGRLAKGARIVNVVSGGFYNAPLNTDMLNMPETSFNGFLAYASHKRAQLALADHWRTAFAAAGVRAYAAHPGWADTDGVKSSLPKFRKVLAPILRNGAEGVDTIVWLAATAPPEVSGEVWFDRKPRTAHVYPHTRTPKATPQDIVDRLAQDRDAILNKEPVAVQA